MCPWQQQLLAHISLWNSSFMPPSLNCLWIYIWLSSCPFFSTDSPLAFTLHGSVAHKKTEVWKKHNNKTPSRLAGQCWLTMQDSSQRLSYAGQDVKWFPGGIYGNTAFAWASTAIFSDYGMRGRVLPDGCFSPGTHVHSFLWEMTVFIFTGSQVKSSLHL